MKHFSTLILLLNAVIFQLDTIAAPIKLPETFPQPVTFRAFDNLSDKTEGFKKRLDEQLPYPFIHSPGADKKASVIRQYWPDKIITLQDAYGGITAKDFDTVWPGHLLYKAGALLTKDMSAQDSVIEVDDLNRIAKNRKIIKKKSEKFPYALIIYALNDKGQPDWSQAEHVILDDIKDGKLIIKRGQWGTNPLSFKSGKAVVAAHMMFWTRQWQLNFSLHSPRGGKDNLTAAEWFAKKIAQRLPESKADGIEFDVGRWTWGNPKQNPMDINNDRIPDYGYIDGVNSFGLGGQVFFRDLRKLVGPDKIIQVDSNNAIHGVRGWKYINGAQLESFPTGNDFDFFSQAFTHLRLWVENAEALPHLSYPFTKVPTTTFSNAYLPKGVKTDFRFRVGLAAACLLGMPHPFASISNEDFDPENPNQSNKKVKQRFGVFDWDEYHGGSLNDWRWLGRPVNSALQDSSDLDKTNLLAKTQWQWVIDKGFIAEPHQEPDSFSTNVQSIPQGILPNKHQWFGVRLEPKNTMLPLLTPNREYTLEFEARGDDNWHYLGQIFERVPRMITISGAITAKRKKPLSVLIDATWKTYRLSFIADSSRSATPIFGTSEQIGRSEIRNIKLYAGGVERWSREFEKGLVLLNMTSHSWTITVPKGKYKRLKGKQSSEINTGQIIDSDVIVPARDALFLIKR